MSNFNDWFMRIEDGDECNIHDRVWEGDYSKRRDVRDILEEAFEAGFDKANARIKYLEGTLMDIQNTLSFLQQKGVPTTVIITSLYGLYEQARDTLMETNK